MRETEAMLEKASVEKSQVDRAKGKTLDEISTIVQKINAQLKDKKNKLAPQIKALRSVRQNFQGVEVKYLEKKCVYDQAKTSMDSELSRVAGEVKQLEADVLEGEQQYHVLNMQLQLCDSKMARAAKEAKCLQKQDTYSKDFKTLTEAYKQEIQQLDQSCNELRARKKTVQDSHEGNLKQKKAFSQLEALMKVKLKVARQEMQNMVDGRGAGEMYGTRPGVQDLSTAGVERLVIE